MQFHLFISDFYGRISIHDESKHRMKHFSFEFFTISSCEWEYHSRVKCKRIFVFSTRSPNIEHCKLAKRYFEAMSLFMKYFWAYLLFYHNQREKHILLCISRIHVVNMDSEFRFDCKLFKGKKKIRRSFIFTLFCSSRTTKKDVKLWEISVKIWNFWQISVVLCLNYLCTI